MRSTLENNNELDKPQLNERFTSIACGTNGDVYTVFTSVEDGNSNLYLRIQTGQSEPKIIPVAATKADEYDGTVIADAQGRVWICWTSNLRGQTYNIYLSDLESIQNEKPAVLVSLSKEDAMHGRMAADASNNIWITYYKWQKIKNNSRDKEVYVRAFANGVVSKEIHVSPADVSEYEDHTDPTIAVLNGQPVVCWSWDFHKPKGYTQETQSPTIFARSVSQAASGKLFHVSDKQIEMAPTLEACGDGLWCAWDSLGRGKKMLCVRRITANAASGRKITLVDNIVNTCSPDFAFYNDSKGTLIWSQTENGKIWSMWKSDYNAQQKKWGKPVMIISTGNPRFGSCDYDAQGKLWLAYSIQTEKGRKVIVEQSN